MWQCSNHSTWLLDTHSSLPVNSAWGCTSRAASTLTQAFHGIAGSHPPKCPERWKKPKKKVATSAIHNFLQLQFKEKLLKCKATVDLTPSSTLLLSNKKQRGCSHKHSVAGKITALIINVTGNKGKKCHWCSVVSS